MRGEALLVSRSLRLFLGCTLGAFLFGTSAFAAPITINNQTPIFSEPSTVT